MKYITWHVGQLCWAPVRSTLSPNRVPAEAAAYVLCYLLIEAGYFIAIAKSQCVTSIVIRFLGFLCDSFCQAFLLPPHKKLKFKILREEILSSSCVGVKTLQRFVGKVISFKLAISGCKLYVRETFKAISQLSRSSKPFVRVEGSLRTEVLYWRFLDDWKDCFPWRSELHVTVSLFSDVSTRAWGAVLFRDGRNLMSRYYWPSDRSADVNLLESRALLNALVSFKSQLSNSRVDVHIDNKVLKSALDVGIVVGIPQSTRLSKKFIVIVEIRTSVFKLSTYLRRIIPLTSLRGSVRIWTVCFPLELGYLWNACSVLIHSI